MVAAEKYEKDGIQGRLEKGEEQGERTKLDEMAQKARRVGSVIREPKQSALDE